MNKFPRKFHIRNGRLVHLE